MYSGLSLSSLRVTARYEAVQLYCGQKYDNFSLFFLRLCPNPIFFRFFALSNVKNALGRHNGKTLN